MRLQHQAQFCCHGLLPRERHRHVCHEAADVPGKPSVDRVAVVQLARMYEVGPPDGILASLDVAAPIPWLRWHRRAGLTLRFASNSRPHPRLIASRLTARYWVTEPLWYHPTRLPWRRLRLHAKAAQLPRKALSPGL